MTVNVDELVLLAEQALTTPSVDAPAALEVLADALLVAGIGRTHRRGSRASIERKQRRAAYAWAQAVHDTELQDPGILLDRIVEWQRAELFAPKWIRERIAAARLSIETYLASHGLPSSFPGYDAKRDMSREQT